MSFEFPVEIPGAPPPPGPNIITVGPRPLKVPICKECIKQRKMIQKLVHQIEKDNDKAKDIQEQQDDMIESYRYVCSCASSKVVGLVAIHLVGSFSGACASLRAGYTMRAGREIIRPSEESISGNL